MMDRLENFDEDELSKYIKPPKIKIFGVGGAGNNIIERLYVGNISSVETIALNTDATHLNKTKASIRKVIGAEICNTLKSPRSLKPLIIPSDIVPSRPRGLPIAKIF